MPDHGDERRLTYVLVFTAVKQLRLIQLLDEEDRQPIFKLIDKMLTNKKFKDFFQKNVAALKIKKARTNHRTFLLKTYSTF
ncbi:MAG: hypothetical protein R6V72_11405 [Cyclobacterium sp.]|uniref:hypothetical protein n=1 Tax=unclassified Cyclobacterium TaxID=2615055 RepID=UPI001F08EBE1|nr:hypothetical protein [Cyclobacterium sp. SYSU L10401]